MRQVQEQKIIRNKQATKKTQAKGWFFEKINDQSLARWIKKGRGKPFFFKSLNKSEVSFCNILPKTSTGTSYPLISSNFYSSI